MNAQQEQTVSILRELIETCRDGQEGFRTASEAVADDPELKMLLSSFSLQRAKFAGELESQVLAMGEHHPEREGSSLSGAAHRGWIHLKSAVTGGDNHAILAECERGEDVAKEAYERALSHSMPDPVREIVQRQKQEVVATHNTIRALRDATPSAAAQTIAASRERVAARAEEAAAGASDVWHEMKSRSSDLRHSTEQYIRKNPVPSLVWALLAGFGIGMIFYAAELRNERSRIQIETRPLRRFGIGLLAWLGLMRAQAKSGYKSSLKTVRHGVEELADRMPKHLPAKPRQRARFSRKLRNAWSCMTSS